MKLFFKYLPTNLANKTINNINENDSYWNNRNMILDGTSLLNLHVLSEHTLTVNSASALRRALINQDLNLGIYIFFNKKYLLF